MICKCSIQKKTKIVQQPCHKVHEFWTASITSIEFIKKKKRRNERKETNPEKNLHAFQEHNQILTKTRSTYWPRIWNKNWILDKKTKAFFFFETTAAKKKKKGRRAKNEINICIVFFSSLAFHQAERSWKRSRMIYWPRTPILAGGRPRNRLLWEEESKGPKKWNGSSHGKGSDRHINEGEESSLASWPPLFLLLP